MVAVLCSFHPDGTAEVFGDLQRVPSLVRRERFTPVVPGDRHCGYRPKCTACPLGRPAAAYGTLQPWHPSLFHRKSNPQAAPIRLSRLQTSLGGRLASSTVARCHSLLLSRSRTTARGSLPAALSEQRPPSIPFNAQFCTQTDQMDQRTLDESAFSPPNHRRLVR